MDKNFSGLRIFQLLVFLILIPGFYLPILAFFLGEDPFNPGERIFQFSVLLEFLEDSWNLKIIWFTFYQAFLSALFSILVGLPGARIVSRYDFPGKKLFQGLTFLPFILPSILVVLGMILFFGNNGFLNRLLMSIFSLDEPPLKLLYSFKGIMIAHVFYNFPIVIKTVGEHWERISPEFEETARTLGANRFQRWFRITLPLLSPSILSAFMLIFLLCLNSFAIILVLGGGVKYTTIEVMIYQMARIDLDFQGAASLAFLQLFMSLFFLTYLYKGEAAPVDQEVVTKKCLVKEIELRPLVAGLSFSALGFYLAFGVGPLLTIVFDSFREFNNGEWGFTLKWYQMMLSGAENNYFLVSLWNSLRIALVSGFAAMVIGFCVVSFLIRAKGWLKTGVQLFTLIPVALSMIVFGVAWFNFFHNIIGGNANFILIIILMHSILTYPYWVRVVLPAWEAVPPEWQENTATMGGNYWAYFRYLLLPWLKRPFLVGFSFAFSISLGELNGTLMIADERVNTLPLEIYRAISGYHFSYASAVAVVLLLLSVITFYLVQYLTE